MRASSLLISRLLLLDPRDVEPAFGGEGVDDVDQRVGEVDAFFQLTFPVSAAPLAGPEEVALFFEPRRGLEVGFQRMDAFGKPFAEGLEGDEALGRGAAGGGR